MFLSRKGQGKTIVKLFSSVLIASLCAPPLLMAQEEDQLGQLSLADLLNMEITVASARAERTSDAPGAVTAWSDQDIQRFGVNTIQELGDMTPGYSSRTEQGITAFETRGGTSTTNEKHLLLLDGMPIQHTRNGKAPINEELPLLFAKRVEFLRGPASALYGIGAFNGVINVVSKSLEQEGSMVETKMQVGVESGSSDDIERLGGKEILVHNNEQNNLLFSHRFIGNAVVNKKLAETHVGYGFYRRESSTEMGYDNFTTPHGPYRNAKTTHFGRIQTKIKEGALQGIGLGFIGLYSWDNYGQGWHTESNEGNYRIWETLIPYLRYDRQVAENVNVMAYAKFNYSKEKGAQTNTADWWPPADGYGMLNFDVLTKNVEAYGKVSWDIIEPVSVIAGVNLDARWQDSCSYVQSSGGLKNDRLFGKAAWTYSAFAQVRAEAPVLNGLIFTGGLRSDNGNLNSATYNQVSPRAAVVLKILESLNLKAMYGTALKAPGQDNVSHNQEKTAQYLDVYNAAHPNNRLTLDAMKAEVIRTVEGNLTFTKENMYLSGTYFYNIIKNSLLREYIFDYLGTEPRVINSDFWRNSGFDAYASGFELEAQVAPIEALRLWVNGGYTRTWRNDTTATGADTSIFDVVYDIPIAKSNIGVNYVFPFGLNAYAVVKGIWALVRPTSGDNAWDDYDPGYWLVDLNLRQPIGDNFNVEFGISNLLNKQYSYYRGMIPGPNRTVSLGIQSTF